MPTGNVYKKDAATLAKGEGQLLNAYLGKIQKYFISHTALAMAQSFPC